VPPSVGTVTEAPERCFPRRDREGKRHVSTLELKQPVRLDVHLEIQIARLPCAAGRFALAGEPDQLPLGDAGRNGDAHGVRP